jgi:hypothetical protein
MVLIAILLTSVVFFAGFLILTSYEARRGARFLAPQRTVFDTRVTRFNFILEHVDFESFAREQIRVLIAHVAHDVAHLSLISVRSVERLLTRLVRQLRTRHGIATASATAPRAFVKTMSDFKQHLITNRPPVPEI